MPNEHTAEPETPTGDLTDAELNDIAIRLDSLLERFDVLPHHALEYRLGEVGSNRVEPHLLKRGLAELANNKRPRRGRAMRGPYRTASGIYAHPDISHAQAEQLGEAAAANLQKLGSLLDVALVDLLATTVCHNIPGANDLEELSTEIRIPLATNTAIVAADRIVRIQRPQAPLVHLWVTHEPDWIYPNDPRLWTFLSRSIDAGACHLVVARKIALACFPLFKSLGAFGLQYYSTLVRDADLALALKLRDALGWSHVRGIQEMAQHPITDHILRAAESIPPGQPSKATLRAMSHAVEREFTQGQDIPAASLLAWWEHSELSLSTKLRHALQRWAAWEAYRSSRSRHVSTPGPSASVSETAQ